MYTFAHKQEFITIDPEIVVKIDALLASIDDELATAQKEIEKRPSRA